MNQRKLLKRKIVRRLAVVHRLAIQFTKLICFPGFLSHPEKIKKAERCFLKAVHKTGKDIFRGCSRRSLIEFVRNPYPISTKPKRGGRFQ